MITEKCNCGRDVRYTTQDGKGSCNKYAQCPTYDELLSQLDKEREENNELKLTQKNFKKAMNRLLA